MTDNSTPWRVFVEAMQLAETSSIPLRVYVKPPDEVNAYCRGSLCSIYDLGGGRVRTSIITDGAVRRTDWDDPSAAAAECAAWVTELIDQAHNHNEGE